MAFGKTVSCLDWFQDGWFRWIACRGHYFLLLLGMNCFVTGTSSFLERNQWPGAFTVFFREIRMHKNKMSFNGLAGTDSSAHQLRARQPTCLPASPLITNKMFFNGLRNQNPLVSSPAHLSHESEPATTWGNLAQVFFCFITVNLFIVLLKS